MKFKTNKYGEAEGEAIDVFIDKVLEIMWYRNFIEEGQLRVAIAKLIKGMKEDEKRKC